MTLNPLDYDAAQHGQKVVAKRGDTTISGTVLDGTSKGRWNNTTICVDGVKGAMLYLARDSGFDLLLEEPSGYEQYLALAPGTRFRLDGASWYVCRVKLDDNWYAAQVASGRWATVAALQIKDSQLNIEVIDS